MNFSFFLLLLCSLFGLLSCQIFVNDCAGLESITSNNNYLLNTNLVCSGLTSTIDYRNGTLGKKKKKSF